MCCYRFLVWAFSFLDRFLFGAALGFATLHLLDISRRKDYRPAYGCVRDIEFGYKLPDTPL